MKKSQILKSLNELEESHVCFEKSIELNPYLIVYESLKQSFEDKVSHFILLFILLFINQHSQLILFVKKSSNLESKSDDKIGNDIESRYFNNILSLFYFELFIIFLTKIPFNFRISESNNIIRK